MVHFRVLGPLSIEPATPRGRQRAVLETLLIRAGEVVHFAEMTAAVWSDAAPTDPRNAIQVLIGRLRHQLSLSTDPAVLPALITHGIGYQLLVNEECCDLPRFERLVHQACRATDPHERDELVAEATRLWRGEPFADSTISLGGSALAALRHQARLALAGLERLRVVAEASPPTMSVSKLRIPAVRSDVVPRSRVTEELAAAIRHSQVVLLQAPAGYGKSTALSLWAAQSECPVGWVNLDGSDNEPARFWLHVGQAIAGPCLDSGAQPGTQQFLDVLLNHLDALGEHRFLVLDDYHLIINPDVHTGFAEVLRALPPQVGVIIACRGTSGLPLARLRSSRWLAEMGIETLRFTEDEADRLLSLGFGVTMPDSAARTDGWAAGLCLLGLALRGRTTIDPMPGRGHFLEYMETEVLDRLPREILAFLTATCVLEKLRGDLCDAVTLTRDGTARLAQLRELNLFLIEIDADAGWYRYHHLFAEALRERLHRDSPDIPGTLHRRAAGWYAVHGFPDDAIGHTLAGADFTAAAGLIASEFRTRHHAGELVTLGRWLRALPDEVISCHTELTIGGTVLFHMLGDLRERDRWSRGAYELLSVEEIRPLHHLHEMGLRQEAGDIPSAIREGYLALDCAPPHGFVNVVWWEGSCRAGLARALLFAGRFTEAAEQIAQAEGINSSYPTLRMNLCALRGLVAGHRGDFSTAAGAVAEAEDLLSRIQVSSLIRYTTEIRLLRALLHLTADEPAAAADVLSQIRASPAWPHPDQPVHALTLVLSVRAESDRQQPDAALRFLADLDTALINCPQAMLLTAARAELRTVLPDNEQQTSTLTERESTVLRMLRSQATLPEIAQHLWLSPNTVKTHVRSIYRKLGVSSRSEVRGAGDLGPDLGPRIRGPHAG